MECSLSCYYAYTHTHIHTLGTCTVPALQLHEQSRMGGSPSFLHKTSDSHLTQGGVKKERIPEASNCRRVRVCSGSRHRMELLRNASRSRILSSECGQGCHGPQLELQPWTVWMFTLTSTHPHPHRPESKHVFPQ